MTSALPGSCGHHRTRRSKTASKAKRLLAGLALPTVATVALMFCAAGAAVATSSTTQTRIFSQSAAAMASPQRTPDETTQSTNLMEIERAQASATVSQLHEVGRATEVARGVERKNLADAKRAASPHSWRLPIDHPASTSGFGCRWGQLHAGEHYAVSVGTPLASMSTGTVIFAGQESGFGNIVRIRY